MFKRLLIDHAFENDIRVVLLDELGKIENISIESYDQRQIKGNIYLGKIKKIDYSLKAAFVSFAEIKHGFLPLSDEFLSQNHKIDPNQNILVQVSTDPRLKKGAKLTTNIKIAGYYCIFMSDTEVRSGISQKIRASEERKRIKSIIDKTNIPKGMGVVVRTAAEGASEKEIRSDIRYLIRLWKNIQKKSQNLKKETLIYEEGHIIHRSIRNLYKKDVKEILVESKNLFKIAKKFMQSLFPTYVKKISLWENKKFPLFYYFKVDQQIENILSSRVELPSGGNIVINRTEALWSIDVNSGKTKFTKDVIKKTNWEAADIIANHLRLRNISGIIIIDFIGIDDKAEEVELYAYFKSLFKKDSARIKIAKINEFGLLELSRERINLGLSENQSILCPQCHGNGIVRSYNNMAFYILKALERIGIKEQTPKIVKVYVSPKVGEFLLNKKRDNLVAIEKKYMIQIHMIYDISIAFSNYRTEVRPFYKVFHN